VLALSSHDFNTLVSHTKTLIEETNDSSHDKYGLLPSLIYFRLLPELSDNLGAEYDRAAMQFKLWIFCKMSPMHTDEFKIFMRCYPNFLDAVPANLGCYKTLIDTDALSYLYGRLEEGSSYETDVLPDEGSSRVAPDTHRVSEMLARERAKSMKRDSSAPEDDSDLQLTDPKGKGPAPN